MEKRSIIFGNKRIAYTAIGSGIPVILLHGFGEDSHIWHKQLSALAGYCKLIVPDIPGSGESELIPGAGIDEYAESIQQIIHEQGESVILLGHSMGGYIALAVAERYPTTLCAIGLVHSTAYADSAERKEMRKKAMDFMRQKGGWTFLKTSTPGLFCVASQEKLRNEIAALSERNRSFTVDALCQYYQAMMERPDRTDVLRSFRGPVLMVIGEQDPAVPFASSLEQSYLPTQSHVHILRQSAHMGMWEETDKLNELIGAFITHCENACRNTTFNKN